MSVVAGWCWCAPFWSRHKSHLPTGSATLVLALLWQNPRFGEPIGDSRIDFSMIHRGSAFGGPTMGNASSDWEDELERWLGHSWIAWVIRPGDGCVRFTLRG